MNRFTLSGWFLLLVLSASCGGGGGGPPAPPVDFVDPPAAVTPRLLRSDNQSLAGSLSLPRPGFLAVDAGGELWTQVLLPGSAAPVGPEGEPGVPLSRQLFGIPEGATPILMSITATRATPIPLHLFPYQPLAFEGSVKIDDYDTTPPPPALYEGGAFQRDAPSYAQPGIYPTTLARVVRLGSARGLSIGVIECACGEYDPVAGLYTPFTAVDFEVRFEGGTGLFLSQESLSGFERYTEGYSRALLNQNVLREYVGPGAIAQVCVGEELLILTHPSLRVAADDLAAWKNGRGLPTSVFEVNDGMGPGPDTAEEIDAFIDLRYETCIIRPSYILLLGDAPLVPTFIVQRLIKDPGVMIATDYHYATYQTPVDWPDMIPDFAVGRIPAFDQLSAQIVVDKIKAYEGSPVTDAAFYSNAMIASLFQCCQSGRGIAKGLAGGPGFIRTAEQVREGLLGLGKSVQRIYNTNTVYHSAYMDDPTPRAYANGGALPADLAPGSGFSWTGSTADVVGAFNAGRFLAIHVDHGWTLGWGDPPFNTTHFTQLHNGPKLPVVFSENCSSGEFDGNKPCFAESLLGLDGGGAIGVFAWTRMSNTFYGRSVLHGTLGAIWPEAFPQYNAAGTTCRRLGDLLNHSRMYMMGYTLSVKTNSLWYSNTVNHVRLYHLFGDPTLSIRTEVPSIMSPSCTVTEEPEALRVAYPMEGALITAMQEDPAGGAPVPIGRGIVEGGVARIPHEVTPMPGLPFFYYAEAADAVTTQLQPR